MLFSFGTKTFLMKKLMFAPQKQKERLHCATQTDKGACRCPRRKALAMIYTQDSPQHTGQRSADNIQHYLERRNLDPEQDAHEG